MTANLVVAWLGKWASIVNAFLFIGLDLVARDRLHETWHGRGLVWKMGLLIATGSLLSWQLNRNAGMIAIASFVAFALAAITDAVVYAAALRRGWPWLQRSNGSNVASAAVDSLVFPTIAFGGLQLVVTMLQFLAKIFGGAVWSVLLRQSRPVPPNNGFHLTGELVGLQTEFGFGEASPEAPAGEPNR